MPRVRRNNVPPGLLQHLLDRVQSRKIPASQLELLAKWLDGEPEVPEGLWYKRFAGMTVRGEGQLIKTFLLPGQAPNGQRGLSTSVILKFVLIEARMPPVAGSAVPGTSGAAGERGFFRRNRSRQAKRPIRLGGQANTCSLSSGTRGRVWMERYREVAQPYRRALPSPFFPLNLWNCSS